MNECVKMRNKGSKSVLVRLPASLVEKFQKEARGKGLTLSSYLRMQLYEHLKQKGLGDQNEG